MTDERWDVIVIGAGLGGLLTAAILARRGRRVLVLEREERVGGRLRSYDVDGFVLDAGSYLWPNAHLGRALEAAGATTFAASRVPLDAVLRVFVQGDGGRPRMFPWPGRLRTPETQAEGAAVLRSDVETVQRLQELWESLAALSDEDVGALMHTALGDALARFTTDARVAAAFRRNVMVFGTYDPDHASMGECIRLRRRPAEEARGVPECAGANAAGGVRALAVALDAAAGAAGVDLRRGHTVEQIAVEAGRVVGVYGRSGATERRLFQAAAVVCNTPVWTLFDLISPAHFPASFVADARAHAVVGGAIAAAFAFDGLPRLRATGAPDEFRGWTRLLIGPAAEFGGGLLWTTLHSPHNAPAGKQVLQAMRLSPQADLADAGRVDMVVAAFRAMVDEIYLDADARLLWSRSWISRDGSEYMVTAAPRPPVQAPGVAGLYFVGETTDVPAVQMDAAALSALRCAEYIEAQL